MRREHAMERPSEALSGMCVPLLRPLLFGVRPPNPSRNRSWLLAFSRFAQIRAGIRNLIDTLVIRRLRKLFKERLFDLAIRHAPVNFAAAQTPPRRDQ